MLNYFVYVYLHESIPFYVGMGKNDRHLSHLQRVKAGKMIDNPHLENKIKKILAENKQPAIIFDRENISETEAKLREIELIKLYGRNDLGLGPLTNLTNGGDGRCGWSAEQRKLMSRAQAGKISVKDKSGNRFKVSSDDPRIKSGELVGQNRGIKFNDTTKFAGFTQAKELSGKTVRVKKDDPRWKTGQLVGINAGKSWSEDAKNKMIKSLKMNPHTGAPKKPCTIDGKTIFPSYSAMAKELGRGKKGTANPNFRYLTS
jgi:hypothetical protein